METKAGHLDPTIQGPLRDCRGRDAPTKKGSGRPEPTLPRRPPWALNCRAGPASRIADDLLAHPILWDQYDKLALSWLD